MTLEEDATVKALRTSQDSESVNQSPVRDQELKGLKNDSEIWLHTEHTAKSPVSNYKNNLV